MTPNTAILLHEHCRDGSQLYALMDAAHPPIGQALSGPQLDSPRMLGLFNDMPEQEAQAAGPYLLALNPLEENDMRRIDWLAAAERAAPCVSWIWTRARPASLFAHLQQQLIAALPDGSEALLRFYDPRVLQQLLGHGGLNGEQRAMLAGPVTRWQWHVPGAGNQFYPHGFVQEPAQEPAQEGAP